MIGSGPIVIGQACEFDYSGCQALKVLREDGFRTVVVNSNPATIMTDPGFADRTYVEPLDLDGVTGVLERERPDALLPTLGGQTALNLALELSEAGVLDELGVELIGAGLDVIRRAEDRELFRDTVRLAGYRVPASTVVTGWDDVPPELTFPVVLRPAFTLGGHGGGTAHSEDELVALLDRGLHESPVGQVLVEESLIGWDEFELEVMRDRNDNVVIVCSIENLDPMGVHTGDSVTVAPQMTLADEAYQELRDAAAAIVRAVGVETGGANIQFARDRDTGALRVIEMNPRVSRSSALASKATGYPIAKVAAKLAVGYTLDEIPNDLTGTTPASFEPTLDYVVVKFPRFSFEKFPGADRTLGTQMKSVGEAMGIGRSFSEAFLKAQRARELDDGWEPRNLHPWFEGELEAARRILGDVRSLDSLVADDWLRLKRAGWSDAAIAEHCNTTEAAVRAKRRSWDVRPVYRRVDSCAGEVEAASTYYYSTWGEADELPETGRSVVILGSGPNRIGQGIEFDYCCVHAARSFRELGFETVMVNCNPETVSTDYDTSDRLYFEPLGIEEVLAICEREQPVGVVIQFGGQTPLKLAHARSRRPASGSSGRRSTRSTSPRIASSSARSVASSGSTCRRGGWRARRRRRSASPSASATRFSCGRPTCSAAARWSSATTPRRSRQASRHARAFSSTGSWRARSSSTSTRCATAARRSSPRSCSTSRRPASTRETRAASCLRPGWTRAFAQRSRKS